MVNVDVVVEVVVDGDVDVVGGATQYAQCDAHMESRPYTGGTAGKLTHSNVSLT